MKDTIHVIMGNGFTKAYGIWRPTWKHLPWQMSSCCAAEIPSASSLSPDAAALSVFGDGVSWSQTVTHAASDKRSLPHVCSVKPAIVPVREFAREKQLPLVKWQLSTGEICLLLPPTQTMFERQRKPLCYFTSSCKGHFSPCFSGRGRF